MKKLKQYYYVCFDQLNAERILVFCDSSEKAKKKAEKIIGNKRKSNYVYVEDYRGNKC